ncbi:hypothetical protein ETB97_000997 [Aspergillus alliaceus]|uniref:DUF1763-domain-containing protein n=1 Tax=Petromyces alliaceus TaxID=209559 RepID=A0A5N7CIB3_PETAA|nr:uncharacterized protein BDW43DRAFT_288500 [Aspergillus alliaceus]KAB8229271.1 hypothetical protein BDW43DRAFT_288500 [Aspergillus alliaceus]KAE8393914.1 hypothetical protein BDV23DRAFT_148222 [Aspergillus alliaceus]KAF5860845.1 hypothetical protein ETB97_000997 [Aspergillus burnettii]
MHGVTHVDKRAIIQAYRHLYRQGLQVINHSTPSRHVLLRILRSSFRSSSCNDFDPQRIANTLRFLQRAADVAGLEHKIVKNLLMVRYWEQPQVRKDLRVLKGLGIDQKDINLRKDANEQFNLTLMLLNESLGTCLK